ncbi:hypothetical protein P1J78_13685 [Psychromarinibacter sp. C21-152]|uniref:Uncharacterized protein n=1 Tax=Psychromarinibacter sediminicola TaxID=3033385 RepID=A0AAE3T936_9RHOB|nr:hypothetical protein [Psychromarinibacter sediminicola]MDF0601792.1 hypothetical protein [Psychromarinibacter sediminicola]
MRLSLILALILALLAWPAAALELKLSGFYSLNRPASLEYDPAFCGLWIANEGPETILVTLDGVEMRRWRSDLYRIKAIALQGNDLIVADGMGEYQRVTKDGTALGPPFRLGSLRAATEGMVVLPDGLLVIVEDDPARIVWVDEAGAVVRLLRGESFDPPLTEPQGIARDPRTGHLLIVDDWEGTNSLYELDPEGRLLGTLPLIEYGRDPEGIAIRAGANLLFLAFDGGARIAALDYTPTVGENMALPAPGADCAIS